MTTPNLNLDTEFVGRGPTLHESLKANFEKIDAGPTGSQVSLTGYVAGTAAAVAAADTVNAAIAKLEARIIALETP